jgi:hypothetical protein
MNVPNERGKRCCGDLVVPYERNDDLRCRTPISRTSTTAPTHVASNQNHDVERITIVAKRRRDEPEIRRKAHSFGQQGLEPERFHLAALSALEI